METRALSALVAFDNVFLFLHAWNGCTGRDGSYHYVCPGPWFWQRGFIAPGELRCFCALGVVYFLSHIGGLEQSPSFVGTDPNRSVFRSAYVSAGNTVFTHSSRTGVSD